MLVPQAIMGVHESTRNRPIIILVGFPLLTEELVRRFGTTAAYNEYIELIERKLGDADVNMFGMLGLPQHDWRNSDAKKRYLPLRASVHDFHIELCTSSKCFERSETCMYHYRDCSSFLLSHAFHCLLLANHGLSY